MTEETNNIENHSVGGSVAVGRDVTVGGRSTVRGNATFDRDVYISGWLNARNIRGAGKGLYETVEKLNSAYPNPENGWFALVGDTLPADLYRAWGGEWKATGQKGGEPVLELANLTELSESLENEVSARVAADEALKKAMDKNVTELKGADTEHESRLLALEQSEWPLSLELSINPILIEFTGNDQTIKVSYSIKRKDVAITPTSLALSVNGTMQEIDIKASDTISIEVNKEGESTLVLTAKHDDLIKSATAKVMMVLPIYFGFGTSEADVAIAGNKLGPRISATGVYEKTSAKDNVNFIILVPKTLEGLSSFTMGGAPFVMNTSSVVINGKDYYMYKSGGVYMSGTTVRVQAS